VGRPLALVTGASSGIGATFARALARRGYDLVLVARRKDRLEALAGEIGGEALPADLTDEADLKRVEDRIGAADNLELLVNNAGFGTHGRFWEADLEGQDRMHRLHIVATMRLSHAALRGMVARGRGGLINVSSVAGFVQSPGSTSYGATKRWINAFTEGLYLELKSAGSPVKVQALCPGFTYSEFHDVAGVDRNLIAKSLWMRAEDVVEASLRGLDRGDLFVVPGWRYKFLVRLLAVVPDGLRRWGSIRYADRTGRG
jgi:short-subunit dehydrogenase